MPSRKQALGFVRNWLLVPGALVLAGTAYGYVYWHTVTILEYRETLGFKAAELRQPGSDVVRISGLAGHSALAVKNIMREREGSSIVVLVRSERCHFDSI